MTYETIIASDKLKNLAINLVHREREVAHYQTNIDHYVAMLENLPQGDVPPELIPYINMETKDLPHFLPIETVLDIANYNHRDYIRYLIRTEHIEQNKSKHMLSVVKAQIPEDQLATLVADALVQIGTTTGS